MLEGKPGLCTKRRQNVWKVERGGDIVKWAHVMRSMNGRLSRFHFTDKSELMHRK